MYNGDLEIKEAADVWERALRSLRDAGISPGSARGWGMAEQVGA